LIREPLEALTTNHMPEKLSFPERAARLADTARELRSILAIIEEEAAAMAAANERFQKRATKKAE
jgi:hypothetical protein